MVEPAGADRDVDLARTPDIAVGGSVLELIGHGELNGAGVHGAVRPGVAGKTHERRVDRAPVGVAGDAALVADPADVRPHDGNERLGHEAADLFSEQERAALAWAEEVTRVSETHASDEAYAAALAVFGEKDLVDLTLTIAAMNAINRMGVSFRMKPRAKA